MIYFICIIHERMIIEVKILFLVIKSCVNIHQSE